MKLIMLAFLLCACEPKETFWRGLPQGVSATCEDRRVSKLVCAGSDGFLYTCIPRRKGDVLTMYCGRAVVP